MNITHGDRALAAASNDSLASIVRSMQERRTEELTYATSARSDEHLVEFRARCVKEGHTRFAGHRSSQQSFT